VVDATGRMIPHPCLHERRVVLMTLAEIAPDLRHPLLGLRIRELLARCPDTSQVLPHTAAAVAPAVSR